MVNTSRSLRTIQENRLGHCQTIGHKLRQHGSLDFADELCWGKLQASHRSSPAQSLESSVHWNHLHGVIVSARAPPHTASSSLLQQETSIGTPIGAPDCQLQKGTPQPSSARHHCRRHECQHQLLASLAVHHPTMRMCISNPGKMWRGTNLQDGALSGERCRNNNIVRPCNRDLRLLLKTSQGWPRWKSCTATLQEGITTLATATSSLMA